MTLMMLCFCFSPLLVFLKDPSCSHLMQTVFSFSHKTVLRDVYRSHLRTQLMPLTLHPIANYTVQSLISASARFKVVRPFSGSLMSLTFALIKLKALKILLLIIILRGLKFGDGKTVSPWLGLGTELGTFKGTDRIASVLPSIDSH